MAPGAPSTASSPWIHVVVGGLVLVAGIAQTVMGLAYGQTALVVTGSASVGSGITFLGVGAGVASQN